MRERERERERDFERGRVDKKENFRQLIVKKIRTSSRKRERRKERVNLVRRIVDDL